MMWTVVTMTTPMMMTAKTSPSLNVISQAILAAPTSPKFSCHVCTNSRECREHREVPAREDCDGAEAKDCRQVRRPRPSRQPLLLSGGRQALVSLLAARWKSPYPSPSGETEVKAHQGDPHPMDDDPTPSQLRSIGSNRLSRVKPGMRLLPPLLLLLPRLGHLLPQLPRVTCL